MCSWGRNNLRRGTLVFSLRGRISRRASTRCGPTAQLVRGRQLVGKNKKPRSGCLSFLIPDVTEQTRRRCKVLCVYCTKQEGALSSDREIKLQIASMLRATSVYIKVFWCKCDEKRAKMCRVCTSIQFSNEKEVKNLEKKKTSCASCDLQTQVHFSGL